MGRLATVLVLLAVLATNDGQYLPFEVDRLRPMMIRRAEPGTDHFPEDFLVYESNEYMLGVILPMSAIGSDGTCSLREESDLQILESLLYALDYVRNRSDLYPFRLGAVVLDSCNDPKMAVQSTVKLVMPILMHKLGPYYYECEDNSPLQSSYLSDSTWRIVGIIGSQTSDDCIQMSSVIQMAQIPQIGHQATSPELSDNNKYPYFMRTVATDRSTVRAIIALLYAFRWTYVSAVYDDSLFSLEGFSVFEDEARASGICFATTDKIQINNNSTLNGTLNKLNLAAQTANATVVVVFASYEGAKMFFQFVCQSPNSSHFIWIGVDTWVGRGSFRIDYDCGVLDNTIGVAMRRQVLDGFKERYTSNRPSRTVPNNPWMTEYFESSCDCTYNFFDRSKKSCKDIEESCARRVFGSFEQDAFVSYMSKAVLAYAEAFKTLYHASNCPVRTNLSEPLCKELQPEYLLEENAGMRLTSVLRNISFFDFNDAEFHFLNGTDGLPFFSIYAYKFKKWHVIGSYIGSEVNGYNDTLEFLPDFSTSDFTRFYNVNSRCSLDCKDGEIKTFPNPLELCCWTCTVCDENSYIVRGIGSAQTASYGRRVDFPNISDQCLPCPQNEYPNDTRTGCQPYRNETISSSNWYWIALISTACLGLVLTVVVSAIFWKFRDTPIVRAADQTSSFLVLFACALTFNSTFIIMSPPSTFICAAMRCSVGISETLLYSTIFAKTFRIMCIFKGFTTKPFSLFRHRYALAYVILGLLGLELIILIAWMTVRVPEVKIVESPATKSYENICYAVGIEILVAFALPIILAICSTVIAFRIRKIPDGFNEQKGLPFVVCINTLLLILSIPPLVSGLNYHLRIASLSIQAQLNAVVVLLGLFLQKIYIMLFRPEKNTSLAVMSRTKTQNSGTGERLSIGASETCERCDPRNQSPKNSLPACDEHDHDHDHDHNHDHNHDHGTKQSGNGKGKAYRVSESEKDKDGDGDGYGDGDREEVTKPAGSERPRVRFSLLDVRALVSEMQHEIDNDWEQAASVTITELEIDPDSGCAGL